MMAYAIKKIALHIIAAGSIVITGLSDNCVKIHHILFFSDEFEPYNSRCYKPAFISLHDKKDARRKKRVARRFLKCRASE